MAPTDDLLDVDAATLRDLDVLSTSTPQGPTLLKLVDRTRTHAGRDHLRRLLMAPRRSAGAILALQQAYQALAADHAAYDAILRRAYADDVGRYLAANWQLPHARGGLTRMAGRAWQPSWYREYVAFADKGRVHVAALLTAVHELRTRAAASSSALLREIGEALARIDDAEEIRRLRELADRSSIGARERFDELARDFAKETLLEAIDLVGVIESWWSLAVATLEHGWVYPVPNMPSASAPSAGLHITGLVHPFLPATAIRNTLEVSGDVRVCFVTGPNMGGKSTFLKAVAIAMLLAHCGAGVPATRMAFTPVGTIFSSVQLSDSIAAGESFYLAEVRRIRDLATALIAGDAALAILDEPFRGTNVHDAADATIAIIERLVDHNQALVFIASHIAEVVPSIGADRRVCLLHFQADLTNGAPTFDYMIRPGVSTQRLGMTLLKQEAVLDLLERATRSSGGESRARTGR